MHYRGKLLIPVLVSGIVLLGIAVIVAEREKARSSLAFSSASGLAGIAYGMSAYLERHGMYPSAVMDTNGKPMSWRAAIAMEVRDYIGQDYVIPYSFERSSVDGMTNYVGVVGECTIFKPDNRPMRREDILDGTKNTVIVIETHFPTLLWRSPGDLSVAELEQWYELHRDRKPGLLFADGSYAWMTSEMPYDSLFALLTVAGGEPITQQRAHNLGLLDEG